MSVDDAFLDTGKVQEIRADNNYQYLESRFKFINAIRGLRPGCLHMLIGTAGSGKSTIVNAIMQDTAEENTILLWQSEESVKDFQLSLSKNFPGKKIAQNIKIVSELDLAPGLVTDKRALAQHFESVINEVNPRAVFIDNITTSALYEGLRPEKQTEVGRWLKKKCAEIDCPFFLIAHTGAQVTDNMQRLIEDTDIRGGKGITNLMPYLFIFQRFQVGEIFYPTMRIRKHRGHQIDCSLYHLTYSKEKNTYTKDFPLPFEKFKETFKSRNKLS